METNNRFSEMSLLAIRIDHRMWSKVWQALAGSSVVVNLFVMIGTGGSMSFLAGMVAIIIAPWVVYKQRKLADFAPLRTTENKLREEVNRLQGENSKLSTVVKGLHIQAKRLDTVERSLSHLTVKRGTTVDKFVGLVKENEEILNQIKLAVRGSLLQTVLTSLIHSDEDSSGHFSDRELQIMELRVKHLPGVKVNHSLLMQRVKESDRSLQTILQYAQHFGLDDTPQEERIFMFDEAMFVP